MYFWPTPKPVTVPRIMENQMEKTTENELETGVIGEVRDQEKTNKDQKAKKRGQNKLRVKQNKILGNRESFKDWGSPVQGRGSKTTRFLRITNNTSHQFSKTSIALFSPPS